MLVGRDFQRSSDLNPHSKQEQLQSGCSRPLPVEFSVSRHDNSTNLLDNVFQNSLQNMFSLYLTGISLGVTWVYHHLASKMSLALFSLHHLIRYMKEAIRQPLSLACLGQNKLSPFSLSLYVMCSSSVDILVALCWTCSRISVSFLHGTRCST